LPILGDLSRRHARIRRDGEGYMIEALRDVRVDDRPVRNVGWLRDGSRIQLGDSVRLVFRRPHALSGTARLDFVSRHRTQTVGRRRVADGRHVRAWSETPLSRGLQPVDERSSTLSTRNRASLPHAGSLRDRRQRVPDRGSLTKQSRVRGEGFSFNLDAQGISPSRAKRPNSLLKKGTGSEPAGENTRERQSL